MSLPGFALPAAQIRSSGAYPRVHRRRIDSAARVVPQDCDFFKGLWCGTVPTSFCWPLLTANKVQEYADCMNTFGCLECVGTADWRDKNLTKTKPDEGKAFQVYPQTVTAPCIDYGPVLSRLERRLVAIQRCACPPKLTARVKYPRVVHVRPPFVERRLPY